MLNRKLLIAISLVSTLGLFLACGEKQEKTRAFAKLSGKSDVVTKPVSTPIKTKDDKVVKQAKEKPTKTSTAVATKKRQPDAKDKAAQVVSPTKTQNKGAKITADDVRRQTQEAIDTYRSFSIQRRKEYHARIDQELTKFNQRLAKLQQQAEKLAQEAKQSVDQEVQTMSEKLSSTEKQLADLNNLNDKQLVAVTKNLDTMLAGLEKSFNTTVAESKAKTAK